MRIQRYAERDKNYAFVPKLSFRQCRKTAIFQLVDRAAGGYAELCAAAAA